MKPWNDWLSRAASLRRFLLVWMLSGLWLSVAAVTLWHVLATWDQVAQAQDARLLAAVSHVVQDMSQGAAEPVNAVSSIRFRVSAMNGDWLAGDRALAAYPWRAMLPASGLPELYVTHLAHAPVRAAAALRHVPGASDPAGAVLVQVAEPLEDRFAVWRELPMELLGWVYGLAAAMSLVIWSGVTIALRWLDRARLAFGATRITHGDDAPYDGPAELRPAVDRMRELHRRQREWVDQQRRFLADASHQLRTPMSVLRAQLQSALAGDVAPAEVLPQMLHTVDRATGMANQLLSLSKLEQIKRAGELQPIDLRAVARDAVMELSPLIAAKRLDFALEGDALFARADALMLGELLRNLLANAIHHTPQAGRVGILLRAYAGTTELVVWDSGPGLDDEVRPRLFQAFSAAKGGVGLGLSICRQIADAMGASMGLYNRIDDGRVIGVDAVVTWGQGP
ncbi:HAMP domain-containing sensor histidine kinase [Piscinibacter gummiphilus]|uniref:histidine kinase n=1 Tax=Piscinibacter gummiphilus TaxID=946333 RepID=A0ABZ0D1P8_9BURK|nr:HAMP domain-containing sensor histidine kinase [Piscinibacter gummiphilus]WOB09225.1 HAMP domain-containing sensor histidine kinase [Piscinibacter gummiphilus]